MSTIELDHNGSNAIQAKNPAGHPVHIDDNHVFTPIPTTGRALLALVGKKPCAYELFEQYANSEDNNVVLPDEVVVLPKPGFKRFVTAHREIVTITINGEQKEIQRGPRSVAELLALVGQNPDGYLLLIEKNGMPPIPVSPADPVSVSGCETFFSQVSTGSSS